MKKRQTKTLRLSGRKGMLPQTTFHKRSSVLQVAQLLAFALLACLPASSQTKSGYDDYTANVSRLTPKSPSASSLLQYLDYPVSLYTGVPQITIPLCDIQVDGLSIPVSLSYHASGIRASQEASNVGLGWVLHAGGMISRTVKCSDDFNEYPSYSGMSKGYIDSPVSYTDDEYYLHYVENQLYHTVLKEDSEPDIFFFSIPGGSGKFLINKSHDAVLFDSPGSVHVSFSGSGGSYIFHITSSDGTLYTFEKKETTWSYGRSGYVTKNNPNASQMDEDEYKVNTLYDAPTVYTSSWLLTEIRTIHNRSVRFLYQPELYQLPVMESMTKLNLLSTTGSVSLVPADALQYQCSKTVIEGWRLSEIRWDGGRVVFDSSEREDIRNWNNGSSPERIDQVRVLDNAGNLRKAYRLDYDYFNESHHSAPQVFKRLKLLSVTNLLDADDQYSFSYYPGALVAKNSNDTDFWGYPNGIRQGSEYYCAARTTDGKIYLGADKTPSLKEMLKGMLKTISSPTGNVTEFSYEQNTYRTHVEFVVTRDKSLGLSVYQKGLYDEHPELTSYIQQTLELTEPTEISMIGDAEDFGCRAHPELDWQFDGNAPLRISRILSDGTLEDWFCFKFPENIARGETCSHTFNCKKVFPKGRYLVEASSNVDDLWFSFSLLYKATESVSDSVGIGGGLRIREITGPYRRTFTYEGGELLVKPVFIYQKGMSIYQDELTKGSAQFAVQTSTSTIPMVTLKGGYSVGYGKVSEHTESWNTKVVRFFNMAEEASDYPFISTYVNYHNGLPVQETIESGGKSLSVVNYEYSSRFAAPVPGFVFKESEAEPSYYVYYVEWPMLVRKETVRYEDDDRLRTEEVFSYNDYFQQSAKSVEVSGDIYQNKTFYATDFMDSTSMQMADRHMTGIPIEESLWKNGLAVKGVKTEYELTDTQLLPQSVSVLSTTAPLTSSAYRAAFRESARYSHFDSFGNPMQVTVNGEPTTYLWGYRHQYVIAEIANATFAAVSSSLGAGFIERVANQDNPSASDLSAIRNLQVTLPQVQVHTYSYIPLVGLQSETGPDGFTVYYGYDAAGRLAEKYLLDGGQKYSIEKYRYHYRDKHPTP